MNVHFLPTVSVVFFLEYTVMLLLITSAKVRSTTTYMCEISSILLKFCARFWQISIFSARKEWQTCTFRSSRRRCSVELATILKKRLWHRCFPVNFAKFLRTPFLQNTSGWLLLFKMALSNFNTRIFSTFVFFQN